MLRTLSVLKALALVFSLSPAYAGQHPEIDQQFAKAMARDKQETKVAGRTELMELAALGPITLDLNVEKLLSEGADVNAKDANGLTALHYACGATTETDFYGTEDLEAVKALIGHGARVDAKTKGGLTPLMVAAYMRRLKTVETLVEHGADVNARSESGVMPLDKALQYPEIADYLNDHGAKLGDPKSQKRLDWLIKDYQPEKKKKKECIPYLDAKFVSHTLKDCEKRDECLDLARPNQGGENASEKADCAKSVMNAELDQRLLSLKKTDPQEFGREMALQATFNKAAAQVCSTQSCQQEGSMWSSGVVKYNCLFGVYRFRAIQAARLNQSHLSAVDVVEKPKELRKSVGRRAAVFKSFAQGVCKMPANLWEGGRIPPDCEKRLLYLIEIEMGLVRDDICDQS